MADWESDGDSLDIDADWIAGIIAERGHESGFTANQATRNAYNAEIYRECLELYAELVETGTYLTSGPAIYIIATTEHSGTEVDEDIEDGYAYAAWLTNQPLLGYWRPEDVGSLDAVMVVQVIREEDAKTLGRRLGQMDILKIWQDGECEPIDID